MLNIRLQRGGAFVRWRIESMPRSFTQYRIFIGSPGGLEEERKLFRAALDRCTELHGEPRGVTFYPVGWEETVAGVGRPQELINKDLRQCDYAIFVLHDRWGSPTGNGHSSGTEEEWKLAEELYRETKIRNIALFFKQVEPAQMRDPGEQLRKVVEFRRQVEGGKKYFKSFATANEFRELMEIQLAKWLIDEESHLPLKESLTISSSQSIMAQTGPCYKYWKAEAILSLDRECPNYPVSLFCAQKAFAAASTQIEQIEARNLVGHAHVGLKNPEEAIAAFTTVVADLNSPKGLDECKFRAHALFNKAIMLRKIGRTHEEITAYDEMIEHFGAAKEPVLLELVAMALFEKGVALTELGKNSDALATYDNLISDFGSILQSTLRKYFAAALANKGVALWELGYKDDAIAIEEEVVTRFGSSSDSELLERVARALLNKGAGLLKLRRRRDAIEVYEDIVRRFGSASEPALREPVAQALVLKGFVLCKIGRIDQAIQAYDEVIARFGSSQQEMLRDQVAKALIEKGRLLAQLGRSKEAIMACDEVIVRFGSALEPALRDLVEAASINKVIVLSATSSGRRAPKRSN